MSVKNLALIIGENIVIRRKKLNISQKELAAKLDISYESMGRIEHGKISPKIGRLQDLAYHLQCPVAYLFTNQAIQTSDKLQAIGELLYSLSEKEQEALIKVLYTTAEALQLKNNKS